jgi:UDP-glucose 4-epimerase
MQRYLVTGGAGFIGSHLVEALLAIGHRVVVLDDLSTWSLDNLPCEHPQLTVRIGDVHDRELTASLLSGVDGVFHLAALIDGSRPEHDVSATTWLALDAAAAGIRRTVYASSAAVYPGEAQEPVTERTPPNPVSFYGMAKLLGETQMLYPNQVWGTENAVLRLFNVYGPRQRSGLIPLLLISRRLRHPFTLRGSGQEVRDFVHVSDVVRALIAVMELPARPPAILNVGTGRGTRVGEVISLVMDGVKPATLLHAERRSDELTYSLACIDQLERRFGWRPETRLEHGIAALLDRAAEEEAQHAR